MSGEELLVVLAGLCLVVLLAQGIVLWQTARIVKGLSQRIESRSRKLEENVRDLTANMHEITENLKPLSELSEDLGTNVEEISALIQQRSRDFDAFAEQVLKVGREQASKIDYVVTDTVQKFEQTTAVIQRDILRPAREISALVKGLRTGLSYLFSKKPPPDDETKPAEKELFI